MSGPLRVYHMFHVYVTSVRIAVRTCSCSRTPLQTRAHPALTSSVPLHASPRAAPPHSPPQKSDRKNKCSDLWEGRVIYILSVSCCLTRSSRISPEFHQNLTGTQPSYTPTPCLFMPPAPQASAEAPATFQGPAETARLPALHVQPRSHSELHK